MDDNSEILDLVDEKGKTIGQAARGEIHGDPTKRHRAVHIFVVNKRGEYYLQKRSAAKRIQPGKWDTSVGGHLAVGEDYEAAALREIEEELGIKLVDAKGLKHCHDYVWVSPVETEHVRTFMLEHQGPFAYNRQEIDEGKFWAVEQLLAALGGGELTPNLEEELRRLGLTSEQGEND